jgi:hypothetical protein
MTDIDDQLLSYAQRWRTAQPPPLQPALAARSPGPRWRRFEHPVRLVAIAATVAVLVAGVAVYAATRHSPSTSVSTGNGTKVPVATPPLVFSAQPPPRLANISVGPAGSIEWKLAAGYLPTQTDSGLGPGLCLWFGTNAGIGSPVISCVNPATTPSLTADIVPLAGDPSMLVIAGVTSAPAATFSVTVGTASQTTPALTNPALGSLRLYAVSVPAADYQRNHSVIVLAVSADGAGLLRNDPRSTATLHFTPQCPCNQ